LSTHVRVPQHVVYRGFGSETVALNLATGKYHGLNPTAGRMLEVLRDTPVLDEAAVIVAREFDVPLDRVRQELVQFSEDLAARGLVELSDLAISRP
jgi:hypothetical protein